MLAIILLTMLSLFAPVFGLGDHSISALKTFSAIAPILVVILVVFLVAFPMAFIVVRRLRRDSSHTKDTLRDTQVTIASLTHGHIHQATHIIAIEQQNKRLHFCNQSLFGRCTELEATNTLATEKQNNLETRHIEALAEIDRLKIYIAAMAAQQAQVVEEARALKDALDEANQQKFIVQRHSQLLTTEVQALLTEKMTSDKTYELECALEEKDAQLYDARRRTMKVNALEGRIEELDELNARLRHSNYDLRVIINTQHATIRELEDMNDDQAVQLELLPDSISSSTLTGSDSAKSVESLTPGALTALPMTSSVINTISNTLEGTNDVSSAIFSQYTTTTTATAVDSMGSAPSSPLSPTSTLVSDSDSDSDMEKESDDSEPAFAALPPRRPRSPTLWDSFPNTTPFDGLTLLKSVLRDQALRADYTRWQKIWFPAVKASSDAAIVA